ncbi:MAG: MFS transporter [Bifidobacteriaceae bacterium]|jgi:MFS family permease|nr:MFS transporter [Bifidobacteriaceae bacterium]
MTSTRLSGGALAPLAISAFRALWIAQLISNLGSWMQSVGAQWLLVDGRNGALLTAMVSAASLIPVLGLSLPAGVLADSLDRRWVLVFSNSFMCLAAGLLTVLTWTGNAGPSVVLMLTFALGCGAALGSPAWQAIQPDLVPRDLLLSASALSSANINIARAVGPAVAGALVAWAGPALVFGINAVSFLAVVAAIMVTRTASHSRGAVGMAPAIASGLRYVRNAPGVRRIALRAALFVVPASALWALLAVVAHGGLRLGSDGYGLMLAALGVGAIGGALVLPYLKDRLSNNAILTASTLLYAACTAALALTGSVPLALTVLLLAGVGWVCCLSVLNTAMLLSLPNWVRARSMAIYNVVFMGGQGVGALFWGAVANTIGPDAALLAAAAITLMCLATMPQWPLYRSTGTLDREIEPMTESMPDDVVPASAGPVQIQVQYHVEASAEAAFRRAARALAASRRRTGATAWDLWQDVAEQRVFIEEYTLPTWGEHLAQREERMTGYDRELEREVLDLAAPDPGVRHLVRPKSMPKVDHGLAVADLTTKGRAK